MENTKITITPMHLCYNSRKPLSILLKLKRILISTNYQLQKFQCKKQIPLRNGVADLSPYVTTPYTTFNFNLSKQLELANTKVDIIVFGFLNKDVNLLGLYQNINFKDQPLQKQLQLKLEKSQDPNSYLIVNLTISRNKSIQKPTRETRSNSDHQNTLKTESYNRQSLLIGRRKNPDIPTAYQISRKNYKQTQVIRITQERSHSRSRNNSGSYKKRFQYQYKKQITSRQQQQLPQAPPSQRPQKKSQSKGSPMPRIKTPQPFSGYHSETQIPNQKNKNKQNQRSSQKNKQRKTNLQEQLKKSNFPKSQFDFSQQIQVKNDRLKIIIDLNKQRKYNQNRKPYQVQQQEILKQSDRRRINQKQNNKLIQKQNGQQKKNEQGGYHQQKIGIIRQIKKQETSSSQKVRQNKINIPTLNIQKNPNLKISNNQSVYSKDNKTYSNTDSNIFPNNPAENYNDGYHSQKHYKQIKSDRDHKNIYAKQWDNQQDKKKNKYQNLTYNNYRHTRSYQQQPQTNYIQSNKNPLNNHPNNNRYQNQSMDSIHQQHQQKQTPRYNQPETLIQTLNPKNHRNTYWDRSFSRKQNENQEQKQKSIQNKKSHSNQSDNRFKSIADKFQKIQQKIKQANKSSPSQSPSLSLNKQKQSLNPGKAKTKNDEDNLNFNKSTLQQQQVPRKPNSPFKIVNKYKNNQKNQRQQSGNTFKEKSEQKKEKNSQTYKSNEDSSVFNPREDKSVAHFSISEKDWVDKNKSNIDIRPKQQITQPNINKTRQQFKHLDKQIQILSNQAKNIRKKVQYGKLKNLSQIQDKQQIQYGVQTTNKKQQRKSINIISQFQVKVLPTINFSEQKRKLQNKNSQKIHKNCEDKIANLQHLLDQQQQEYRKNLLQKQFQYKNQLKKSQKKQKQYQRQLQNLKQENQQLKLSKQKQNKQTSKKQLINSQSTQQINRLKEQNLKLRNLVDKINKQLEQSDEKHFQALTANQKKDLQYQRKLQGIIKKNAQLNEQIKKKQQQLKQNILKYENMPPINSNKKIQKEMSTNTTNVVLNDNQNRNNLNKTSSQGQKQQYLSQKKKNVNLQAQIRIKDNQIRFLKIRNQNLQQQKKNLQNQIDNIAANNKLQMARQGSITKMNLQASSVTKSVKVQNKVLKQQINSLQKQVRQLNQLLEGIIIQGNTQKQQISQSRQKSQRQNEYNLERKYQALEKKTIAYQQEIKNKQMKIAEIINVIFGYNNPKLIDQVSKIVGMTR